MTENSTQPKKRKWLTTIIPYLIMLGLVIIIRTFIIGSFSIPSASMETTLQTGDIILVNYLDKNYTQGDIIVFKDENNWLPAQGNKTQYLVKRLLADEGDTIRSENGTVYLNNQPIEEPYIQGTTSDFPETLVPKGKMFMLGDNRENSGDSRYFIGTGSEFIDKTSIKGKPFTAITFSPLNIRNPQ